MQPANNYRRRHVGALLSLVGFSLGIATTVLFAILILQTHSIWMTLKAVLPIAVIGAAFLIGGLQLRRLSGEKAGASLFEIPSPEEEADQETPPEEELDPDLDSPRPHRMKDKVFQKNRNK